MTVEKQNELLKKLTAFAMDSGNKMNNVPLEIMQEISSDVSAIVNPLQQALAPFFITAFEYMAEHMRAQLPREAVIADKLKEGFGCTAIFFKGSEK